MISIDQLADPTVRALVTAINAGDRAAFLEMLTSDATMSDDGTERNLHEWIEREIFSTNGHMEVESQSSNGRTLVAMYRNDTFGEMRTSWAFTVANGKISRMETGQA